MAAAYGQKKQEVGSVMPFHSQQPGESGFKGTVRAEARGLLVRFGSVSVFRARYLRQILAILCLAFAFVCLPIPSLADETPAAQEVAKPLSFSITLDPALQDKPYSGRVYVVLSKEKLREARLNINDWFEPAQVFAVDVKDLRPGQSVSIDGTGLAHPRKMADLPVDGYQVQAVARRSLVHPVPGRGPGDLYNAPTWVDLDPSKSGAIALKLDKVVEAKPFAESDRVKLFEMVSPSLSKFHGCEVRVRAGVVLPTGWKDDPSTKYPVLYVIGGFGGDHHMANWLANSRSSDPNSDQILKVVPDPTCYRGHSVFADSENNGPWGQALTEELIPAIEVKFHGANNGRHRYVTGVSSGGWSSLWLQVTYPDTFNGCWSHCPDPVDFRDFQQINLYEKGSNMYRNGSGARRPLARMGDRVMLWYEDFVRMEDVLGPGGQIHSFEAVFSPKREDGTPRPLFDRATGEVDTATAKTWERYDIRLVLERNWKSLAPKLAGKLHIYAGGRDTFYLEGAVALLQKSLTDLGSDADVKVIPDMGHGMYRDAVPKMYETIIRNFRESALTNQN